MTMVALLAIAAAATGPARAQSTTVTWNNYQMSGLNLSSQGDKQTTDNVTLTSNGGAAGNNAGSIYFNGAFTFSLPAGSVFTQILIRDNSWLNVDNNNTGWSVDGDQATWTGSARSVDCQITANDMWYIQFTIAPAVPKMYTSDVSITDLVPGDTLAEGATVIGSGNYSDMVYLNFGRYKENGVVPSFWKNLGLPPTVIGTNGTISGTYTPVDGNGRDGNAWVVTDAVINDYYGSFEVGLSGIIIPMYRTLDSIPADWTVKVAGVTQTLQTYDGGNPQKRRLEINQGDSVTLIPDNPRRVKSVTLEDDAPALQTLTIGKGSTQLSGNKELYYITGDTYRQALARPENQSTGGLGWGFWESGTLTTIFFKEVSNKAWDMAIDGDSNFAPGQGSSTITLDSVIDPSHAFQFVAAQ